MFGKVKNIVGKGVNVFSFSYNVFKRSLPQGCENMGLFGKGIILTNYTILQFTQKQHSSLKQQNCIVN